MGAGFLEAFFSRRCLQDFIPCSPEDPCGLEKKF
jgi:hypothetical protein